VSRKGLVNLSMPSPVLRTSHVACGISEIAVIEALRTVVELEVQLKVAAS
jgi:hypothetical protein